MRRLALALIGLLAGCASDPEVRSLEEIEAAAEPAPGPGPGPEMAVEPGPAGPDPVAAPTPTEVELETGTPPVPGVYQALEHKGVRGGRFRCELPAAPDRLAAMLLDFEHAGGHRAWADRFEVLSRTEDEVRARWHFVGKAGVDPAPVLALQVRRRTPDFVVRFRIVEEDFGLAAFFGDYRIEPIPDRPDHAVLTQRVYIDSGLWIANASAEEIEAGLREDARLLRDWALEPTTP
ncbi:MAG: SRPBCC family protein [Planctomycetota bacterium]